MNSDILIMVAGVILSLAFSYVPGLRDKFGQLDPTRKRLVMLGLLLLTAAAGFGLSCLPRFNYVVCDIDGAIVMVEYFIKAAVANQTAYALTPKAAG